MMKCVLFKSSYYVKIAVVNRFTLAILADVIYNINGDNYETNTRFGTSKQNIKTNHT